MSKFSIDTYVRKRSGAFWEGTVVGHYSTEQTPDGVAVQLFGWPNGPVQIYPAAALEPYKPSGIVGERCPGVRVAIAPENHDAPDGDWQKAASSTDYLGFAVEQIVWRGRRATIVDRDFPIGTPITTATRYTPPPSSHVIGVTLSAEQVIAIRDALIADDVMEAYHQLYQAVDPQFSRYEPWADTEAQLRRSPPETPTPPGNQIRTAECDGKDAVPVTGQLPVGTASTRSPLDKETEQKLREALRFAASRSVMSSEQEQRILAALATMEGKDNG